MAAPVAAAINSAVADLDGDREALEDVREAIEAAAQTVSDGSLTELSEGVDKLVGPASWLILGALIIYSLLKDGTKFREPLWRSTVRDDLDGFIGDSCPILRDYGRRRTIMSAIVAVFIGVVALLLGLPLVATIKPCGRAGGAHGATHARMTRGRNVLVADRRDVNQAPPPAPARHRWRRQPRGALGQGRGGRSHHDLVT